MKFGVTHSWFQLQLQEPIPCSQPGEVYLYPEYPDPETLEGVVNTMAADLHTSGASKDIPDKNIAENSEEDMTQDKDIPGASSDIADQNIAENFEEDMSQDKDIPGASEDTAENTEKEVTNKDIDNKDRGEFEKLKHVKTHLTQ